MAQTSTLRCRMIEDMTIRNLPPATQPSYVYEVPKFGRFFNRSPDQLTLEEGPRHLGVQIGGVAKLHTWGQALHHHRHLYCIVPGGFLFVGARAGPSVSAIVSRTARTRPCDG